MAYTDNIYIILVHLFDCEVSDFLWSSVHVHFQSLPEFAKFICEKSFEFLKDKRLPFSGFNHFYSKRMIYVHCLMRYAFIILCEIIAAIIIHSQTFERIPTLIGCRMKMHNLVNRFLLGNSVHSGILRSNK